MHSSRLSGSPDYSYPLLQVICPVLIVSVGLGGLPITLLQSSPPSDSQCYIRRTVLPHPSQEDSVVKDTLVLSCPVKGLVQWSSRPARSVLKS